MRATTLVCALAAIFVPSCVAEAVSGTVTDAATNEPLARVRITAHHISAVNNEPEANPSATALTAGDGTYELLNLGAGPMEIRATTVGYGEERVRAVAPFKTDFRLNPDALSRPVSTTIDVKAGPFAVEPQGAVGISGNELRNLSSVLLDDPLRAVQAMPGVVANDDFQGQISVRGASYNRLGLYLDGVLLHQPFHTVQGDDTSASLTVLNTQMLDALNLHSTPPASFADRTAAILDARTREGRRDRFSARATLSMTNIAGLAEGPVGRRRGQPAKGSWLISARKSYLQYLINRLSSDNTLAFGFSDITARGTYDVAANHSLWLTVLHGKSALDRTANRNLGSNAIAKSGYDTTLATLGWRWSLPSAYLVNRVSLLREKYENRNREPVALAGGQYGEWIGGGDGAWTVGPATKIDFGWTARRMRDDGYEDRRLTNPLRSQRLAQFRGTALRTGGYLLPSWTSGRIQLSGGARWDYHDAVGVATYSPSAGAAVGLWRGARLGLGWSQSAQYPELFQLNYLGLGQSVARLLPERSIHWNASLDQALDSRTRLRVEAFNRLDRDLLFRPALEPRLVRQPAGALAVYVPPLRPGFQNSQRGYARGLQAFLQRRTANGVTGWVSYSYLTSNVCDAAMRVCFPADYAQRHTLNVYASYRWRPSVNISARYVYGSGQPLRGFFTRINSTDYSLSAARNQVRFRAYQRLDLRANKAFEFRGSRFTFFAELINATGRDNYRAENLGSFDSRTGRAFPSLEKTFPLLPTAGLMIEF